MKEKYLELAEHYDNCYKKHGDNHLGMDWPNKKDAETRYEVMYDLVSKVANTTLLDLGCGLGHFYDWIQDNKNYHPQYSGLDINEEFTIKCKEKYPHLDFYCLDILKNNSIPNFDYIIMNGVFTEKRSLLWGEMNEFFEKMLLKTWEKTKKGMAFNLFLEECVDWRRDDLFFISISDLSTFISKNLSKNFVIRNGYGGLFECTVYVYKD